MRRPPHVRHTSLFSVFFPQADKLTMLTAEKQILHCNIYIYIYSYIFLLLMSTWWLGCCQMHLEHFKELGETCQTVRGTKRSSYRKVWMNMSGCEYLISHYWAMYSCDVTFQETTEEMKNNSRHHEWVPYCWVDFTFVLLFCYYSWCKAHHTNAFPCFFFSTASRNAAVPRGQKLQMQAYTHSTHQAFLPPLPHILYIIMDRHTVQDQLFECAGIGKCTTAFTSLPLLFSIHWVLASF